jgi:hypothetical protein
MAAVVLAIWIALALALAFAAVAGGMALAAVRALRTWRAFRRLTRSIGKGLGDLGAKAAATEEKAIAAAGNGPKLAAAAKRLQDSLAELAVLRAALAEAQSGVTRVRGFVPRK